MKIRNKIIYVLPLFLSGCDLVSDTYDAISAFFTTYLPDLVCWMSSLFIGIANFLVVALCSILSSLITLLPEYEVPVVSLADNTILQYTAYFFPVSETATLVFYLFTFYTSFFFLRIVLRWLKVIR